MAGARPVVTCPVCTPANAAACPGARTDQCMSWDGTVSPSVREAQLGSFGMAMYTGLTATEAGTNPVASRSRNEHWPKSDLDFIVGRTADSRCTSHRWSRNTTGEMHSHKPNLPRSTTGLAKHGDKRAIYDVAELTAGDRGGGRRSLPRVGRLL
jgi:hypothetical protein